MHPYDKKKFLSDLHSGLLKNDETYIWLESKTRSIEKDFDLSEPMKLYIKQKAWARIRYI